jgi:hypothetical protein
MYTCSYLPQLQYIRGIQCIQRVLGNGRRSVRVGELVRIVDENDQQLWKAIMLDRTTTCTPSGLFVRVGAALTVDAEKYGIAFHHSKKRGQSYFSLIDDEAAQQLQQDVAQQRQQDVAQARVAQAVAQQVQQQVQQQEHPSRVMTRQQISVPWCVGPDAHIA